MKVRLSVVGDEQAAGRRVFEFSTHDTFLFGRDPRAHCRIQADPAVSRHHFILEVVPPRARLRDLGSKNGVRINGILYGGRGGKRDADGAVPSVDLRHGDTLRVGRTYLRFEIELENGEAPPTEPPTASQSPGDDPRRIDFAAIERLPGARASTPAAPAAAILSKQTTREDEVFDEVIILEPEPAPAAPAAAAPVSAKAPVGLGELLAIHAANPTPASWPKIPGYALKRILGAGGMGHVYLADRLSDGRPVALKALLPGPGTDSRKLVQFRREIAVNRTLMHPNIVTFLDDGQIGDGLFLAMEYLAGGSVEARLKRQGPPPFRSATAWMCQAARGLAAAHAAGLVHRDLKPANLLLTNDTDAAEAKIADFGLAKIMLSAGLSGFTATGAASGPVSYMAPEQLSDFKRATAMADVFSLGATFFAILTGRPPYNFSPARDPLTIVLDFNVTPIATLRPDLPPALVAVIDTCLAEKSGQRYPNAAALYEALAEAVIGPPS